mgnify:CR=1 FL=1
MICAVSNARFATEPVLSSATVKVLFSIAADTHLRDAASNARRHGVEQYRCGLPPGARGVAAIEIQNEADKLELDKPDGVEIRWLVNREPGSQPDLLVDALRNVDLPEGRLAAWAACEFSSMRNLRAFLREDLGLRGESLYISSYWKAGLIEDEHKLAKREDADAQVA